jgi:quercetin dioxygenase-like cupin family protein
MGRTVKALLVGVVATLVLFATSAVAQSGAGSSAGAGVGTGAGAGGGVSATKGKGAAKSAAAAGKGKTFHFVTADQVHFEDAPNMVGIQLAQLWGDRAKDGDSGTLIKFKAGTDTGWHYHSNAIHLVSISGALTIEPEGGQPTELRANAFADEAAKVKHRTTCPGPEDCVFVIHMSKKFDFVKADAGASKAGAPAK